jgi:hypothetical protein
MSEERKKILEMLAEKKISVEEAEKLLAALGDRATEPEPASACGKRDWKYLRVVVEPGPGSETKDRVNIRVPAKLIRAGLKFAAVIPGHAQGSVSAALKEKGIDVDLTKITSEDLEDIVRSLDDITVEVEGKDRVRVFCE